MPKKEIEKAYTSKINQLKKYDEAYFKYDSPIVSDKIYGYTTPYIIKPNQGVIKLSDERMAYYKSRGPEYKPVRFPKNICICHFNSESITDAFMFSALSIVWFLEEWMMPIGKSVLDKIKTIEWDKHAVQGDY